jgi:hypothetical protein
MNVWTLCLVLYAQLFDGHLFPSSDQSFHIWESCAPIVKGFLDTLYIMLYVTRLNERFCSVFPPPAQSFHILKSCGVLTSRVPVGSAPPTASVGRCSDVQKFDRLSRKMSPWVLVYFFVNLFLCCQACGNSRPFKNGLGV